MLNDLFGRVEEMFRSYDDHLETWSFLEEAMGDGDLPHNRQRLAETAAATKSAKSDLKEACHGFFREVIWTAEQSNMTLSELLADDEELSKQWERVSSIVEDTFSREVLWEVQSK